MKPTELAYAAGIIDGEGCIRIQTAFVTGHQYHTTVLRVSATNTYRPVLDWFQEQWGGHISWRGPKPPRRATGEWIVTSKRAGLFLADILPFMVIKHAQADNALAFQATKKQPGRTRGLTDEERAIAAAFMARATELNHDNHQTTVIGEPWLPDR